jgi:hypothetical protein
MDGWMDRWMDEWVDMNIGAHPLVRQAGNERMDRCTDRRYMDGFLGG